MRGFSDEERDEIREALIETGRELFLTYGPDKTNVADITEPVGIAKSTFYRFFDSKAELYLEIFLRERDELLDDVERELATVGDAREGLEVLTGALVHWVEENALLQQIVSTGNARRFSWDLPEETLQKHQREAIERLVPYLEAWQETGELRPDVEPIVVIVAMSTVAIAPLFQEEYPEELYPVVRDLLVETMAIGLTGTPA
ncbi:TetR/AcrR family transcriptional regulator [Halobacteriaceae archaeon GCM10025711]